MKHLMDSVVLFLILASNALLADEPTRHNPHLMPMHDVRPQCFDCHADNKQMAVMPSEALESLIAGDGISTCITCHEQVAVKHMVGKRPDFHVPKYLPLDEKGRITCLTCHYTHGPLRSDKPWVDVSWYERISNDERLHKTFLLRRSNRDGGLCLVCHDP